MRLFTRSSIFSLFALLISLASISLAQWNKKPYSEWSEKETEKVLNDSPWGQTQAYVDTSRMFDRDRRLASGESRIAQTNDVMFRIRFLSAKPIRQAISKYMQLKQKLDDQMIARLKAFAEADFPDYIVVTVQVESTNPNKDFQEAAATLLKLTTSELKNNTYLQIKGERLFLHEYQPPRNDGLGARFVFQRKVNGELFITPESDEVHFFSELNNRFKPDNRTERRPYHLNMRFKIKEMTYNGRLEY
ncbi:MAG TPA: hypothetical protein VIG62_00515 [Blastocatellia bacterium]|jgi:hypothetical protein